MVRPRHVFVFGTILLFSIIISIVIVDVVKVIILIMKCHYLYNVFILYLTLLRERTNLFGSRWQHTRVMIVLRRVYRYFEVKWYLLGQLVRFPQRQDSYDVTDTVFYTVAVFVAHIDQK